MTDALERAAREIAKLFIPAYGSDATWQEDVPMYRRRDERQRPLGQDNPIGAARAAILAFLDAPGMLDLMAEAAWNHGGYRPQWSDLDETVRDGERAMTQSALSALRAAAGGEG